MKSAKKISLRQIRKEQYLLKQIGD